MYPPQGTAVNRIFAFPALSHYNEGTNRRENPYETIRRFISVPAPARGLRRAGKAAASRARRPLPKPPRLRRERRAPRPRLRARALPLENAWIASLADGSPRRFWARELPPAEEIRAAYLWLIENVYFADPVGLDAWRYHGDPDAPPPYLENRALSPLRFGVGSCEDFAAAMAVLLRRMGYKAQYVSGLTISVEGEFVDHAWTVVQLDGKWYHLDPQLEQNVVKSGRVSFRYFLRDDRTMLADHRWGESLAAYYGGAIAPGQRETILTELAVPACPEAYVPTPRPLRFRCQAARPLRPPGDARRGAGGLALRARGRPVRSRST